jgi:hypothetical protein
MFLIHPVWLGRDGRLKHAILHRLLLLLHTTEVTPGISISQGQTKSENESVADETENLWLVS